MRDGNHPILEAAIGDRYNAVLHGSFSRPPRPASFECLDLVERLAAPTREAARRDHDSAGPDMDR